MIVLDLVKTAWIGSGMTGLGIAGSVLARTLSAATNCTPKAPHLMVFSNDSASQVAQYKPCRSQLAGSVAS
ncbi:hypothetical protein E2C01_005224 [Portunus trituberculatus]|uniref:Uncharacterized protein n=1 Tax=Portunus trituberculatus TaxID=210409 RepID=A0A5B7CTF8_PORTR|nr:hypothetical protein [Portunus trituberculatus]